MNKTLIAKTVLTGVVFAASYTGFTFSSHYKRTAGVTSRVTVLSLANQAQAYCNEAKDKSEYNDGKCTGTFSDASTRCLSANFDQRWDCVR